MRTLRKVYTSILRRVDRFLHRDGIPLNLFWLIHAHVISKSVYVVTKLGIADLLKERPRTCHELAVATGTREPELYRILRGLASLGIFAEGKDSRFTLTPQAAALCQDAPVSLRSWTLLCGEELWNSCGQLLESLKTGRNSFELAHGAKLWDYFQANEAQRKLFDDGMGAWTVMHGPEIAANLDLSGINELLDVGGGRGSLMISLLNANPRLQGKVYDRPEAVETCQQTLAQAGVGNRCEVLGGNFLESVPPCQSYIIKHVLHDWENDFALTVLKNIRRAIPAEGKLFIIDAVVDETNGADRQVKWLDIVQMTVTIGHERTEAEFRVLLAEAGFRLHAITHTAIDDVDILECLPC